MEIIRSGAQPNYSKKVIEIADYIYKHPEIKISNKISVFCSKFQKTERTIWDYVAKAKEFNKTRIQKQENAKNDVMTSEAVEAFKNGLLSRYDCLLELSKIAKGDERKVQGNVIIPTDGDRIRAIQQLSKMQGWETEKIDVTTKGDAINTAIKVTIVEKKV